MLEEALRETFAHQVRETPPVREPASLAIQRGRRGRRWRRAAGGVATLFTLAALVGGASMTQSFLDEPVNTQHSGLILGPAVVPGAPIGTTINDDEDSTSQPPPVDIDVRVINSVWTAAGDRVMLTGTAIAEQAYRTPHGLVYGGPQEIRLWDEDTSVPLRQEAGQWVISPDGSRVGGVVNDEAYVQPVRGNDRTPPQVTVPSGTTAVTFWGQRLVLHGPDGFTVWDPAEPTFPQEWTDEVATVYGPAGERLAVSVEDDDAYCVALVPADATTVSPEPDSYGCTRWLDAQAPGWVAPNGRRLAIAGDDELLIAPLGGDLPAQPVTCPYRAGVAPVWTSNTVLLSADEHTAVRCDTITGGVQTLSVPEYAKISWQYVPVSKDQP